MFWDEGRMFNSLKRKIRECYFLRIKKDAVSYAKTLGVRMGEDCEILGHPRSIFGSEPYLVKVGNRVRITSGVSFITHEGALWCIREKNPKYYNLDYFNPIVVGNNVFIGINSVILPGVHIGNNVIIGANSTVTKDVADGIIVAGTPAKQVSTLEKFIENILEQCVKTKNMSRTEKRQYLEKKFHDLI